MLVGTLGCLVPVARASEALAEGSFPLPSLTGEETAFPYQSPLNRLIHPLWGG